METAIQRVGREDQYSSFSATLPRRDQFRQEEVHIHREEDRHHRPSRKEDIYIREERRPDYKQTSAHIDVELPHHRRHYDADIRVDLPRRRQYETELDVTEREYRSRFQPSYREETRVETTVDAPRFQPTYREETRVGTTVDPPRFQPTYSSEETRVETTVDPPRLQLPKHSQYSSQEEIRVKTTVDPPRFQQDKMGYYDEDGHYHSFRHGLHRAADRVLHGRPHHEHHKTEEIDITIGGRPESAAPKRSAVESPAPPHTVTIPCHHIRVGDLLILQGRPCQVIRITTSAATGQHRYLGVDLFTKQLHEESSFISNPSPSVVVQTMLGPVFKQYRVLDLQEGTVVAMTETGDVKQAIPVIDQSNLWSRLSEAFESGRGSVRVLVINDHGRELAVDLKVLHGSRL
ncbi:hypothetical protein L207DRAFT_558499 [Hyaloscypha variabilis F]|uniref:Translation initiation factor 5A-like N-terminal domain-containing protein n=1 Tax=Hyaloscypha variabilis (strain UAMH 11265 / GT02V1 / F) TaxID=1149755 RepID=A0A2J6QZR8_HYAVF|nr:hypothetical protein L207DRAFT_558499 [Hyaloscypha variabilis F]